MKLNSTFLIVAILLIVLVCPGFILISSSDYYPSLHSKSSNNTLEYKQINTMQNEFRAKNSAADTFDIDIDMDEFDEEMKELKKELGKLKSYKFKFDLDNEEFRAGMEELKKELSELKLEDLQFEFDDQEFRKSMALLKKELKEHKFSFDLDMDNFKEEMAGLKEELKDLDFNLKDLDIELDKLDGFIDALKEELESDRLIENKDDDIKLELNKNEMIINGNPVPDELFKKYKDMYEEHLGRKLDDDHNVIIR
jgi:chromosome segregation ATPase